MFDPFWKLALGLLTGVLFGFLLQKGRVAKYQVILGQFLFKDWTVVKIMGTAVVVGAVGIFALLPTEAVSLHIKPLVWGGIIAGGLLFGVGMTLLGYCPGTGVAACGEGRKDAMSASWACCLEPDSMWRSTRRSTLSSRDSAMPAKSPFLALRTQVLGCGLVGCAWSL